LSIQTHTSLKDLWELELLDLHDWLKALNDYNKAD
jgi:hypothetical protein